MFPIGKAPAVVPAAEIAVAFTERGLDFHRSFPEGYVLTIGPAATLLSNMGLPMDFPAFVPLEVEVDSVDLALGPIGLGEETETLFTITVSSKETTKLLAGNKPSPPKI